MRELQSPTNRRDCPTGFKHRSAAIFSVQEPNGRFRGTSEVTLTKQKEMYHVHISIRKWSDCLPSKGSVSEKICYERP